MYHTRIERALKERMTDHHLNLLVKAAERAVVNDNSAVEISPYELLALAGEVLQSRQPRCDCGVSKGMRTDHEAECSGTYLKKKD